MLAEVAARIGRNTDAETLLARCVELAPGFRMARQNYAMMLHRQSKWTESLKEVNGLLEDEPSNPGLRNLKAAVLGRIGNHEESIALYRGVLRDYPRQPKVWMSLGHALKTANHNPESIEAYRRCIELAPHFGEVWWSLANLKTFRFTAEEIANMRAQLERDDLTNDDRFHFHFSLGKALEDAGEYAASFEHYASGNRLAPQADPLRRRRRMPRTSRARSGCSRASSSRSAPDGAARRPTRYSSWDCHASGSTLIEQILASRTRRSKGRRSCRTSRMLRARRCDRTSRTGWQRPIRARSTKFSRRGTRASWESATSRRRASSARRARAVLHRQDAEQFRARRPDPPDPAEREDHRRAPPSARLLFFLFQAALRARPDLSPTTSPSWAATTATTSSSWRISMRCCPAVCTACSTSAWSRTPRARYGVCSTYCGLPFEEGVLRFHENQRAVRTASSEQVRQPIFRDGLEQWRHFDSWLEPLKSALGPVLDRIPTCRSFDSVASGIHFGSRGDTDLRSVPTSKNGECHDAEEFQLLPSAITRTLALCGRHARRRWRRTRTTVGRGRSRRSGGHRAEAQ